MEYITMDNFHDLERYIEVVKEHKNSIDLAESPLSIACATLNIEMVEEILQDKTIDINQRTLDGKNSLHLVCMENENSKSFKITQRLLQQGIDVNAKDIKNRTPLIFACINQNVELVRILIESGSHVNVTLDNGETPLKIVCKKAENMIKISLIPLITIANLLLKAGANREEATCLPVAIQFTDYSHVKELLDSGMNVNKLDDSGRNPLGTACCLQTVGVDIVKLLLSAGANVDKGGAWTKQKPLIFAYAHNSFAKIKVLLSYGAHITSEEMTALVSISISKSILENPEVVNIHSVELRSWRLLLAAGFTPTVQGVSGISKDLAHKINQVQMCSSYQHISPWFRSLIYPSRSLLEWCRIAIRKNLKYCIDDSIQDLEIPNDLKKFLSLAEFT